MTEKRRTCARTAKGRGGEAGVVVVADVFVAVTGYSWVVRSRKGD
jgi:hypothetical protein